jgi:hypothetical protein
MLSGANLIWLTFGSSRGVVSLGSTSASWLLNVEEHNDTRDFLSLGEPCRTQRNADRRFELLLLRLDPLPTVTVRLVLIKGQHVSRVQFVPHLGQLGVKDVFQ